MSLILNETLKLQANALDRASTACLTVGVLAPVAAATYNLSATRIDLWIFVVGAVIFGRLWPTYGGETNIEGSAVMTGLQFFAFVILPVVITAGGWAIVLYTEHKYRMRPGK